MIPDIEDDLKLLEDGVQVLGVRAPSQPVPVKLELLPRVRFSLCSDKVSLLLFICFYPVLHMLSVIHS